MSLNATEIKKLKMLIYSDSDVEKQWKSIVKTADASLVDSPNPVDTILTEGILQGDPRKAKTWTALQDMQKVYALAFAYKITAESKYLAKASVFLVTWANKNKPQGNPINDTNLDRIIFAYDLIKKDVTTDVSVAVFAWLRTVALEEIKTYEEKSKGNGVTYFNNWNSHRIKEIAEVAWAIDDAKLKLWAKNAYQTQISKNLKPDGSSFDFHERDALHYHIYDVDPLMVTATILLRDASAGENPYTYTSPEGNSLKKSVDWLIPFFTGEKTHAEWVNSKSAFDKKRAANGEKGYLAGTLFNPTAARTSIALADYFDSKMLTYYQEHVKTKSKYPVWQFVLNEVKR